MSLEILFHYPKGRSEVNVILIPGIGTPRGQEWSLPARWSEGGLFNTLEHGVAFFAYDYAMRFDSHLTWDLILLEGQRLLQALDHMFPSSPGPILFICHGLGGIVLKQAICFASTCGHSYQNVRDCLSGIIFLGTPHYLGGASPGEFGERLVTLLKLAGLSLSPNARTLETLKATSEVIANLSKRFEQVCIRVNVLSVYERIQSKVREPGSLLKHSTKKVVVDRDLCSLGIVLEQVVGLLVNHLELVSLSDPDGQLNQLITNWLVSVIHAAPENSADRFARVSTISRFSYFTTSTTPSIRLNSVPPFPGQPMGHRFSPEIPSPFPPPEPPFSQPEPPAPSFPVNLSAEIPAELSPTGPAVPFASSDNTTPVPSLSAERPVLFVSNHTPPSAPPDNLQMPFLSAQRPVISVSNNTGPSFAAELSGSSFAADQPAPCFLAELLAPSVQAEPTPPIVPDKLPIHFFSADFQGSSFPVELPASTPAPSHQPETHTPTPVDPHSTLQPDPRVMPCFGLQGMERNEHFCGREDVMARLDEILLPSRNASSSPGSERTRAALLHGLGGVGKTAVAIEYAYSRRDDFDAIFWIHADNALKVDLSLAKITVQLGLRGSNSPDDMTVHTIYKRLALSWLCNPTKVWVSSRWGFRTNRSVVPASWLLILDGVEEPEILAPFQSVVSNGAILITSRNPLAKTAISPEATEIELQCLNRSDAARFLLVTTSMINFARASELAARLYGLPFALVQMVRILNENSSSFNQLHGQELERLIAMVWSEVVILWRIQELPGPSQEVMALWTMLGLGFLQSFIEQSPRVLAEFQPLIRSSFVRRTGSTAYLIQGVTRAVFHFYSSTDSGRLCCEHAWMGAVRALWDAWPTKGIGAYKVLAWGKCEELYSLVMTLKSLHGSYVSLYDEQGNMILATLLNRAGWYKHERGDPRAALALQMLAMECCDRISTMDTRALRCDIHYAIAMIKCEMNDATFRWHITQTFSDTHHLMTERGQINEQLALSYNAMGVMWMTDGHYYMADCLFRASLQAYERTPGAPGDTKAMRTLLLSHLGFALLLLGNLEEASAILERGLADREERYENIGAPSFRTGTLYYVLGNVRFAQARFQESEEFHRRALEHYLGTLGNCHHRTADVYYKMAQHCFRKLQGHVACQLLDRALKIWEMDKETYGPEIARAAFLKARALMQIGQYALARDLAGFAADARRRLYYDPERRDQDLTEADFDHLVMFWSR